MKNHDLLSFEIENFTKSHFEKNIIDLENKMLLDLSEKNIKLCKELRELNHKNFNLD